LDNWNDWRQQIPDLTLEICCPPYAVNWFGFDVDKLEGVNWQGNRCPNDLKREIQKAEYWVYASNYTETYCISALEMMLGNVKIITNGTGNIKNLVNDKRGTIVGIDADEIIKTIVDDNNNPGKLTSKLAHAYAFARHQNWGIRVKEWMELIGKTTD
jgi:glycosyltransferase involved in cell wall biosynthesis